MDNLHKTITQQFKALDVALEKIEKLDKRTKPKPDEGEVLDRSLHKLRQRYSLLQTARKEAIADYDRQLALLDKQIASLAGASRDPRLNYQGHKEKNGNEEGSEKFSGEKKYDEKEGENEKKNQNRKEDY